MADIKEQLYKLNKMSKKSVALYHKFALNAGISDSALGVLYALSVAQSPCSQYDLCAEWSIPKQTINSTVDALRKKGLVTLVKINSVRNKKSIELTEKGKAFASETIAALAEAEYVALSALTAEERELYLRLNSKYNDALACGLDCLLGNRGED